MPSGRSCARAQPRVWCMPHLLHLRLGLSRRPPMSKGLGLGPETPRPGKDVRPVIQTDLLYHAARPGHQKCPRATPLFISSVTSPRRAPSRQLPGNDSLHRLPRGERRREPQTSLPIGAQHLARPPASCIKLLKSIGLKRPVWIFYFLRVSE